MSADLTFDQALEFVLTWEGEQSQDGRDPGGLTRWGISQRAHPDVAVATLTREDARALYRTRYWDAVDGDRLPAPLRLAVFDAAVQHGPARAIRFLQRALRVPEDGVIGPQTRHAMATRPWADTLVDFLAERSRLYQAQPGAAVFGLGWARRLFAAVCQTYQRLCPGVGSP